MHHLIRLRRVWPSELAILALRLSSPVEVPVCHRFEAGMDDPQQRWPVGVESLSLAVPDTGGSPLLSALEH